VTGFYCQDEKDVVVHYRVKIEIYSSGKASLKFKLNFFTNTLYSDRKLSNSFQQKKNIFFLMKTEVQVIKKSIKLSKSTSLAALKKFSLSLAISFSPFHNKLKKK
jgi:hypothetical protein